MKPRSDSMLRKSDLNWLIEAALEKGGGSYHGINRCQNREPL